MLRGPSVLLVDWLSWASIDARLSSSCALTSIAWVISSAGRNHASNESGWMTGQTLQINGGNVTT